MTTRKLGLHRLLLAFVAYSLVAFVAPLPISRLSTAETAEDNALISQQLSSIDAVSVAGVARRPRRLQSTGPSDQTVLCDLYNTMQPAGKAKLANWCSTGDKSGVCGTAGTSSWVGVTCTKVGGVSRVTRLDTCQWTGSKCGGVSAIGGSLPTSIGGLDALTNLNLFLASLTGSIPSQIGALIKLKLLSLVSNTLSGTIPSSLGALIELTDLYLEVNSLSGSIPSSLGALTKVSYLSLIKNSISGSIPPSLGGLIGLTRLDLSENALVGTIPPSFGGLANMSDLRLFKNSLSGSIPSSLGGLAAMTLLALDSNKLVGPIPNSFCSLKPTIELFVETNPGLTCYPSCLSTNSIFMSKKGSVSAVCEAAPTPEPSPEPTAAPSAAPTSPSPAPTPVPTRVVCPVGSYSEGDTACLICPAATTSNAGSTSINACVNVITNFSFAVSSVLLASFVSIVYLYFGRYHRVAHVRRERVVLYQLQQFRNISEALTGLEETLREMRIKSREEKEEDARRQKEEDASSFGGCLHGAKKLLKLLLFYLAVPVILVAAGVVTMLHETLRDLVDVLILFRGLRQYITVPYLAFLNAVLASLGPLLEVLFAPIREILRVLAFLKIDLSALQVTCPGASAPVNLFLDYLILGALIVVVGSDYQLFRSTVLRALQERVSALIFSKEYKKHCMPEKGGKPSFLHRMASAVGLGWCWPSSCRENSRRDELAVVVATTDKAPHMQWGALHYWYFLFCTLLASAASELLDFQLLLRFSLSQVHLDFFGTLTAALATGNDCNNIKGLERADGALAMISFLNAVFMFIPLVFEIGKFVVHGAPPADSDGPIHRANEDIYNNDKAKEERRAEAAEAETSLWNFAWSDFLLWLPSVLAPDLWLAMLSNGWINLLKTAVASSDNDKRRSNKSSWLEPDKKVVQVPPSDEARLALACASALCCPCFRGGWLCSRWLCRRCGCGRPCSQGGVILSVLAPRYLVAESGYSFEAEGSRFESEPASCLVQPSLPLVPEDGLEGASIHPSIRQAVLQWQSKFRKEEDKRWKNSSRGHQLPTFHELLMLYNREWEQLCKVPNAALVLAAPNLFTMGLAGHVFLQSGRAIWGQIVYNFLVFFASCFGVWTKHTQEYYGVKKCVDVMSVASTAGQQKNASGKKDDKKVEREIVEEWQEYSEAWAALIGPRSILLLLVPQLTPLMTFTKITATSPLYIDDPSVPAPHMLDTYSFYRKARREVYLRDDAFAASEEESKKDLLEWMVYLGAQQQYFTSSRLLRAVFNWCKLTFVFGLLASSRVPELQRYVFAAQVGFYFLRGCVLGIKGVVFLGGQLGLKDGDLPFTGGGKLRKAIDVRCRIKMESSYDKNFKPPGRPRVSHVDDVEGRNPMADNHPPSGSQGYSHDQGREQSQTSGHSQSHAQTHSNAHAHAHNQSHAHSLGSAKDSGGVELTERRSNAERSVPAASVVSYSDATYDADCAGYSVHPKNSYDSYHEYNSSSSSNSSSAIRPCYNNSSNYATRPSYNSSSSSSSSSVIRPSRTSEECMREFRDSIPSMQEAAEASSAESSRAQQAWFYSKGGEEYGPNSAEDMGRFYIQYPDDFSPLTPIRLQHWRGCHSAWRVFGSLDARAYFSSVPVYSEPAPCTWLMLHQGREFGPNTADAMQAYFLGFPDVYNAATMVRAEGWRQFHAAADVFGPALEGYFVRSTYAEPHFAQTKRAPPAAAPRLPPGPTAWPAPSTHATSVQGHRGQQALSRPSAAPQSHSMPPSLSPSAAYAASARGGPAGRGGGGRGAALQAPRRRLGPGNNL